MNHISQLLQEDVRIDVCKFFFAYMRMRRRTCIRVSSVVLVQARTCKILTMHVEYLHDESTKTTLKVGRGGRMDT